MSTLDYKTHGNRLMQENVEPGNFGGFLTEDYSNRTETLYAVDRATGEVLTRSAKFGNPHFDGSDWLPCEAVPDDAQWIGNYPAPKARARLTDLQQKRGTRIKLEGKIGGWQN